MKQEELKNVLCEKISCENKYSIDYLINFIQNDLNAMNNNKHKLMTDYYSKRISFEDFCRMYKEVSINYHSLNITKEKLYQHKINDDQQIQY